ncbi:hypothetical protein C8Q79DRAFT_923782 [Trametes meyenii]|nr:hypothetical protein C8Q79DRAFT_923782 [Trametes meyenii]
MVSTRSAKIAKAATKGLLEPRASRAEETAIPVTKQKAKPKESRPCRICGTVLSREADLKRHIRHSHLGVRPFACHLCPKSFRIKRYLCDMALERGGFCDKRFNDGSSLARHRREQHNGMKYQCPFPDCCDRKFRTRTRIKRAASFRDHLRKVHNFRVSSLEEFEVYEGVDYFDGPPGPAPSARLVVDSPAPSYHELPNTHSTPPPPYNETACVDEIPIICTPDSDGDVSTPGLSFAHSPSPSPSVPDVACNVSMEEHLPSPPYAPLDPGLIDVEYGTGFPLEKSISAYDLNASIDMSLMLSDIALHDYQPTYGGDDFDALAYSNMLYQNSLPRSYAPSEMSTYDPFSQIPCVDARYSQFLSIPENGVEECYGQYSVREAPVPEQPFIGQTNIIMLPSLPQFTSSHDIYAS